MCPTSLLNRGVSVEHAATRRNTLAFAQTLLGVAAWIGCTSVKQSSVATQPADTYVVTKHVAQGDRYVIRRGNVELKATCQYSFETPKGGDTPLAKGCLDALPVGESLKMVRGGGDWLFCNWEIRGAKRSMGLIVETEEEVEPRQAN